MSNSQLGFCAAGAAAIRTSTSFEWRTVKEVALARPVGAYNHVDGGAERLGNDLVFVALEAFNNHLHSAHSVTGSTVPNANRKACMHSVLPSEARTPA